MTRRSRVLCVDDEPNVLEGLKRTLRRSFDVAAAVGPMAGLQILEEDGPFAAIVSDLSMPAMNGVAFFEESRKISPNSSRILLTGQADLNTAVDAVNRGAVFRFLLKPCAPDVLHQALSDGVEQYAQLAKEKDFLHRISLQSDAPEAAGVAAQDGASQAAPVTREALMKFLVVESSIPMRRLIVNALQRLGYTEVAEARDGEEALRVFGSSIRCVITGWNLPRMSGIDFVQALRDRRDGQEVPLLMVTSRSTRSDILAAREAGVDGYIVTPITVPVLREKLDSVLRATR